MLSLLYTNLARRWSPAYQLIIPLGFKFIALHDKVRLIPGHCCPDNSESPVLDLRLDLRLVLTQYDIIQQNRKKLGIARHYIHHRFMKFPI